jgi:CRISPR-associated protein Csm2
MQNIPQKMNQPTRFGKSVFRTGGSSTDSGWNEEEAMKIISDSFNGKSFTEILFEILNEKKINNYNDYIGNVKNYVKTNIKGITTNQLRNVFSRIKKVKPDKLGDLYVLRPQLAYVSGKSDKKEMKTLVYFLDSLITKTDDPAKLKEFKNFFEAIVAYHKFYEKGENHA